ncbi:MAG: repeat-associated core domain protein [Chthonomonadaceae bacterium]|nr:repeat-associated core domain protein [Chthonomonadaceae bacterium]
MATTRYTTFDGEIVSENRSGVMRDYVPDPLGSTVALLDSTQTQTDTFAYWPYGENRTRTGTTSTPFQFVGTAGYYRDSTSKAYVRARHIDNAKGRWINEDPIGFQSRDTNLYAYVSANPVSWEDPSGLDPIGGIGAGQCPGPLAVDQIRKLLHSHGNCLKDFLQLCNGQSLDAVLSQITFTVRPHCDSKDPSIPCQVDNKGKPVPGKSCVATAICFSSPTCYQSPEQKANDLLFELGNWCNCKYHKLTGGEGPTVKMCRDCGFPKEQCKGGGIT